MFAGGVFAAGHNKGRGLDVNPVPALCGCCQFYLVVEFGHQSGAATTVLPELPPVAETAAEAESPAAARAPATRRVAMVFFM